jgi:hypothetical protein
MKPKLCIDCAHMQPGGHALDLRGPSCTSPSAPQFTNLVFGHPIYQPAKTMREAEQACGYEARWFTPIEKPKAKGSWIDFFRLDR